MSLTVNIYYTGKNGNARKFAEEMVKSGIVERIRAEEGNERYEYFFPMEDSETVLLIDRWRDRKALDIHHKTEMMAEIAELREKYGLKMRVERYIDDSAADIKLTPFFKSILNEDKAPIVVCDLGHRIIFMNPSAIDRYSGYGGASLLGKSLLDCHNERSVGIINRVLAWFRESTDNNRVYTFRNEKENKDVYMIALRDESGKLIGYYEKHEYRTHEGEPPLAIPAF